MIIDEKRLEELKFYFDHLDKTPNAVDLRAAFNELASTLSLALKVVRAAQSTLHPPISDIEIDELNEALAPFSQGEKEAK
jgi:hypothetical protein